MSLDRRIASLESRAADAPLPPTIHAGMTPAEAGAAYSATLRLSAAVARLPANPVMTRDQAAAAYARMIQEEQKR